MEKNTNKVNKKANSAAVVNMNITANQLYNKIMSDSILKKELAKKTFQAVECDGKKKMVNAFARDYFIDSYKKAETLGNSAEWTARLIISGVMNHESYEDCFVSDKDFAQQIGQSTAYISKAKDAVEIRNWFIENGYGQDWKPSAVEELIKTFKDFKKKELNFNTFMEVTELKHTATVSAVREAKKKYNESLVSFAKKTIENEIKSSVNTSSVATGTTPVNTSSVVSGTITPVNTSSVASGQGKVTGDIDAMSANDVKTKLGFNSMTITINFGDITPITIELTDKDNRAIANPIITILTGKIKEALKNNNK